MKKIFLLLAVAAFAFSPLAVSSAQAGEGKHHQSAKHFKHLAKTHHHHGRHHKAV